MRKATREWLEHLARVKNNSKAQEILKYILELEQKADGTSAAKHQIEMPMRFSK
ncbi:hypothetical protein [uncultured Endozoicomonas sp.]|uniref:hypothetical protein n=1 Tax=uncultured Endozoicomonas sp. TaxID=432652 RepID=UPI00260CAFBF|nr:hypothetical protein [uncultured Endozoicomonas sp.]